MKAILVKEPGGADQLFLGETETPQPKANEILVKIKATALNRMDIIQREGRYPVPVDASSILGVDMAGVVEQVGSQVTRFKKGDEVFGLLQGGGYAEFATINHHLAWLKPQNLSFEEAAAIPEVFMTAYQTLYLVGQARQGESVLIHAGASGVGTAAIQLCQEKGNPCFVTAGSSEKIQCCEALGAKAGFNYKEGPFEDKILAASENGVDVVLDFVGAPYWEQNINCLKKSGRLVVIGYMGGVKVESMNLGMLLRKWIEVKGTTLRARSEEYRISLAQELGEFALSRFADGRLKPVVDRVFSWMEVREAHRCMEENQNIGKIVMVVE